MGVRDLLADYVKGLDPAVKRVLLGTIRAESDLLDLERPRGVKEKIRDLVEEEARRGGQPS